MRQFRVKAIKTPTIVIRGALTYLFDADGNRWRVYDSVEEPHHGRPYRQVFPLGDRRATVRCFAPRDKTAASYVFTFRSDADRDVTSECLTVQLRAAHQFYRRLYNLSTGDMQ